MQNIEKSITNPMLINGVVYIFLLKKCPWLVVSVGSM